MFDFLSCRANCQFGKFEKRRKEPRMTRIRVIRGLSISVWLWPVASSGRAGTHVTPRHSCAHRLVQNPRFFPQFVQSCAVASSRLTWASARCRIGLPSPTGNHGRAGKPILLKQRLTADVSSFAPLRDSLTFKCPAEHRYDEGVLDFICVDLCSSVAQTLCPNPRPSCDSELPISWRAAQIVNLLQ